MLVQWTTLNRMHSGVRWGTRPGKYERSALSEVQSYGRSDMCGAPANSTGWTEPGLLHHALMDSLQPAARYYYTVGDTVSPPPFQPHPCLGNAYTGCVYQRCLKQHGPQRSLIGAVVLVWFLQLALLPRLL